MLEYDDVYEDLYLGYPNVGLCLLLRGQTGLSTVRVRVLLPGIDSPFLWTPIRQLKILSGIGCVLQPILPNGRHSPLTGFQPAFRGSDHV